MHTDMHFMPSKYALCVGLNYPGTSAQLSGCVNDARDWEAALSALGYQVVVLLEPTKAALVAALTAMVGKARFADRVVFTFSGHGTYLPDRNGDESDGKDEALVCADYRRDGILTDDELDAIFGAARYGVRRTIFSDSCHSGSVQRFATAHAEGTPRFLPPGGMLTDITLERTTRATRSGNAGVVLISGCADPEYSYDAWFAGRANGAFTRAALDTLKPGLTMKAWHTAIRTKLPSSAYPQSPQKQCAKYQDYWTL